MSGDKEAQEDELLALASIYDEEEFHRAESAQGGEIQLCLELPPDFKVLVKGRTLIGFCQENRVHDTFIRQVEEALLYITLDLHHEWVILSSFLL